MPILVPPPPEDFTGIEPSALTASAKEWMADAIEALLEDSARKVVSLAPIALEHLGKATLALRNPALLVPLGNGNETSLLVLTGQGDAKDKASLRTIGLTEVLSRAERVLGKCPVSKSDRAKIIGHRNGSIHAGTVPDNAAREVMATVCRLAQWLLADCDIEPGWFYGDRHSTARMLLDERSCKLEQEVKRAVLAAEERYEAKFGAITDAEDHSDLKAMLEARLPQVEERAGLIMHGIDALCPACKATGRLSGPLDIDAEGEAEYEGPGEVSYHGYWVITFMPDEFRCGVCALHLTGQDALSAAGFSVPLELNEKDLDFSLSDLYEPDWDDAY